MCDIVSIPQAVGTIAIQCNFLEAILLIHFDVSIPQAVGTIAIS